MYTQFVEESDENKILINFLLHLYRLHRIDSTGDHCLLHSLYYCWRWQYFSGCNTIQVKTSQTLTCQLNDFQLSCGRFDGGTHYDTVRSMSVNERKIKDFILLQSSMSSIGRLENYRGMGSGKYRL